MWSSLEPLKKIVSIQLKEIQFGFYENLEKVQKFSHFPFVLEYAEQQKLPALYPPLTYKNISSQLAVES